MAPKSTCRVPSTASFRFAVVAILAAAVVQLAAASNASLQLPRLEGKAHPLKSLIDFHPLAAAGGSSGTTHVLAVPSFAALEDAKSRAAGTCDVPRPANHSSLSRAKDHRPAMHLLGTRRVASAIWKWRSVCALPCGRLAGKARHSSSALGSVCRERSAGSLATDFGSDAKLRQSDAAGAFAVDARRTFTGGKLTGSADALDAGQTHTEPHDSRTQGKRAVDAHGRFAASTEPSQAPAEKEPKKVPDKQTYGVLLINLGSPSAPSYLGVWSFLREFLSDPRVVPRTGLFGWLWPALLYGAILPFRSGSSALKYKRIWDANLPHAPLVTSTLVLGQKVRRRLSSCGVPPLGSEPPHSYYSPAQHASAEGDPRQQCEGGDKGQNEATRENCSSAAVMEQCRYSGALCEESVRTPRPMRGHELGTDATSPTAASRSAVSDDCKRTRRDGPPTGKHAPAAVAVGMRYGTPSVAHALQQLMGHGIDKLLVLPLYPQTTESTTASAFDAVARELKQWRSLPSIRFVSGYATHPSYIASISASVRDFWKEHGRGEKLLVSFHGIPLECTKAGVNRDTYAISCNATTAALQKSLHLDNDGIEIVYQSRFGNAEWLQPYIDDRLKALAGNHNVVDVISPGFIVDCLVGARQANQRVFVLKPTWLRAFDLEGLTSELQPPLLLAQLPSHRCFL
eukprot:GHVT01080056.1.p1 GENE.GHVT01080056.1~~GHVT01080056.1.p1  ORF type:complete len:683 (-),score=115.91 GHVT01080056.1:98-2146(-)